MNTPLKRIHRRLISEDVSHRRTGEVVHRLHSFIVIFVQMRAFQVSVLAGSWGGVTLRKLVSENISVINVGIDIKY